jgi:hypothetical protein
MTYSEMRKSSSLWPEATAANSQRGRLPLPDQVSEVSGLRYRGNTFGYFRRGFRFPGGRKSAVVSIPSAPGCRMASRFSSLRFWSRIRADKIALISSWSDQSSSIVIEPSSSLSSSIPPPRRFAVRTREYNRRMLIAPQIRCARRFRRSLTTNHVVHLARRRPSISIMAT